MAEQQQHPTAAMDHGVTLSRGAEPEWWTHWATGELLGKLKQRDLPKCGYSRTAVQHGAKSYVGRRQLQRDMGNQGCRRCLTSPHRKPLGVAGR